ncbi:hypothetical protein L3496_25275 [Klebsiella pneumoniae]|uniref:hypothetical protein n=1 Tax=Klebsiella pneumoniae TaxID=573 RepID=UPI00240510B9|nr:hypothetical protein [Klebsiella pneumoniae]MDG0022427.1 hypothetical protein [Klebsiella pneumoniae]
MAFDPPLGSTSPAVLLDNATRLDNLLNSLALVFPDREGVDLDTWRGIMAKVATAIIEAQNSITAIGLPFTTLAEAQAAADDGKIPDGSVTWVRSEDNNALASEYMNVSGMLTATGRQMLSEEGTNSLINLIVGGFVRHENASDLIFQVVDLLGHRQFYALTSGEFGTKKTRIKPNGIDLEQFSILVTDGDGGIYAQNFLGQRVAVIDKNGVVAPRSLRPGKDGAFGTDAVALAAGGIAFNSGASGFDVSGPEYVKIRDILGQQKTIIDAQGNPVWSGGGGITLQDKIDILNAENLNYYSKVRSRYNPDIERLVFALTLIIWYGQSLSTDQQGFPALSKAVKASLGNLMLGGSSRPNSRTGANFTPVGDAVLNPLKAVVQTANGSAVMTDEEVAALDPDAPNEGEGAVAAVNMLRTLFLKQMSLLTDPSRVLALSSCGVNGRTIEQLSKGASPELYNRVREAVTKISAIADGEDKSFGIGAICFLQGEWNYNPSYGGDTTRAGYKALVEQLYSDIVGDFCSEQSPPAFFTYQTTASFTNDSNELAIGMAQLDLATEGGNYYGVCPSYPFPDKGGHLTSNGYRWMDMFFGKVMFRVLVLGEGWEPLHCTKATVVDDYALLNYAVPYPPLQWGTPYVGRTATTYADRGYRATDDNGTLPITAAEIAADTVVKLTFSRNAVGTVKIWYADKTSHNGNGCLKDSDPFIATENYVYTEGSGQWADENISELVNKPYSLNNWAWAQVITVNVE